MVLLILLARVLRIEIEAMRVVAAFASCLTLLKFLDWFRLFEETAFYVHLVSVTLHDIKYFLVLLVTTLMMFGIPLLMLDGNSAAGGELIEGAFNFWLLDLMYN